MQNFQGHHLCDGCGQTFTMKEWDDRCTPHEPGCPNSTWNGERTYTDGCDCDLNYHTACCPECNEEEAKEEPVS